MAKLSLKNNQGEAKSEFEAADSVFAAPVKRHVVRLAVNAQRANQRAGTVQTKTRGMVSGGGRKPFKQKGTGRARQGSSRAPQMRGGAIIFGPQPRSWRQNLNKKVKRQALTSALTSLAQENAIHVIEDFGLKGPKTKEMALMFRRLGLTGKILLLVPDSDQNVMLSARNIWNVTLASTEELNVYDLVTHDAVVTTPAGIRRIEALLSEKTEEAQA